MENNLHQQASPYDSPWSLSQRIKMVLWEYAWAFLCSWTPKPANPWRLFVLRAFGAKLHGKPFVHQRARIQIPWNLTMYDRAALGDRANAYSLGPITIHAHATVAQEAYICTGTHAFERPEKNLITAPIVIGENAFIGARAFILPGVVIGKNAIVGACSVVTKQVAENTIVKGNPAK
jgi:putative colanic acid biosynthesis acetyltransferase WcaF